MTRCCSEYCTPSHYRSWRRALRIGAPHGQRARSTTVGSAELQRRAGTCPDLCRSLEPTRGALALSERTPQARRSCSRRRSVVSPTFQPGMRCAHARAALRSLQIFRSDSSIQPRDDTMTSQSKRRAASTLLSALLAAACASPASEARVSDKALAAEPLEQLQVAEATAAGVTVTFFSELS